jgi:DNA-binding Lrp family transcriptional regulator
LEYNFYYMDLSATDIKILTLLQQDASLTAAEIAEQVNLSVSPCWRRINRLEREGVIEKEVALLSAEKLGMGMVIFMMRRHCIPSRNGCASSRKWSSVTR